MRKFILISALLLASVSAQAGDNRSLTLAANDEAKAVETATSALAPAAPEVVKSDVVRPAIATADETKTVETKTVETKTDVAKPQTSKSAKKTQARRWEGDEAKARRIAARYGVYW